MTKFRKKPVIVEAVQWNGVGVDEDAPPWFVDALLTGTITRVDESLYIKTLEGKMEASAGDYVIRGVEGELYPCKPTIFEATYEEFSNDD